MKTSFVLGQALAVALLLPLGASSQTFTDYEWTEPMSQVVVPDNFRGEEAVIIRMEEYNKSTFSGEFPYIEQLAFRRTQTHYRIQSEEAIKELQRLVIPRLRGRIGDFVQLKYVDVRIRHIATGEVSDLSVRKLPLVEPKPDDELYSQREDLYIYELPKLEIGDEVEQVIVYEAKFADNGGSVNLYRPYPVLKGYYTLSVPSRVKVDGRIYNGMADPEVKMLGDQRVYKWQVENLPAVPEANAAGSIFAEKLGYFVYELNFDAFRQLAPSFKVNTWGDLILLYAEDFLEPVIARKRTLTDWYEKYIFDGKDAATLEPIIKLFNFHDYLSKNIKIISERDLESGEKSQGIEYFLAKKRMTYNTLMSVYRDYFDRYGFNYSLAIAKNRFEGPLDMGFVSNSQVSSYFFVVEIPNKGQFILEPLAGFNQVGTGLMGTKALMRNIKERKADLLEINLPDDALKDPIKNKRIVRNQYQIDAEGKINQKTTLDFSGCFSAGRNAYTTASKADTLVKLLQQSYQQAYKDRGKVEVVSAKISKWDNIEPYPFRVEYEMNLEGFFDKKDENTWVFNMDDFLNHNVRQAVNDKNRVLDYHLPFAGGDVEDHIFSFDREVSLEGIEAFKVEQGVGSYQLRIMQLNPKTIRLESRYTINQLFLPAKEVTQLKELSDGVKKLEEAKLTFKFKANP